MKLTQINEFHNYQKQFLHYVM